MADRIVQTQVDRGIHHIIMSHGANALDPRLITELRDTLRELVSRGAPPAVLRSAHPSVFCPGWDLKILGGVDRNQLAAFLDDFNALILELFSYPGPTAAAVQGHAVGAGCTLAIACDLRIMLDGRPRLGFSELNLGVPVPARSMIMLRSRLSTAALDEMVFRGEGCTADRARTLGVVQRVASREEFSAVVEREAGKLASYSQHAYRETKQFALHDTWTRMSGADGTGDEVFLDCWFDEDTRDRMSKVVLRLQS